MAEQHRYRITFINQGKVYEIFARAVYQEHLYGFITVEDLVFGERSQVVVDPSEEKLRDEFAGVRRFHVPLHSVIRIDEVADFGSARIRDMSGGSNVHVFPGLLPPGGSNRNK